MRKLKNSINIIALLILITSCKTSSDATRLDASKSVEKTSQKDLKKLKIDKANTVFFDFDSSKLTYSAKKTLKIQARWIKNTSPKRIVIQGHCDERGSRSYNLALGKRRALEVKDFLVDRGVDPKILKIVSYGEDKPALRGQGEKIWEQNRRAVTVQVK